jgi:hypothetical protein
VKSTTSGNYSNHRGVRMSSLPCVAGLTRERVAREFNERGPEVCRTETALDLHANNPELLDIAVRRARAVGDFAAIMTGFSMFYRLLTAEARAALDTSDGVSDRRQSDLLPRVSRLTRAVVVRRIDDIGSQEFTRQMLAELERNNPELLRVSQHYARDQADYGGVMEGFALLYACLLAQARVGTSRHRVRMAFK